MNGNQNKTSDSNPVSTLTARPKPVRSLGATLAIGAGVGVVIVIMTGFQAVGIAMGIALGAVVGAALVQADKRRTRLPENAPRK